MYGKIIINDVADANGEGKVVLLWEQTAKKRKPNKVSGLRILVSPWFSSTVPEKKVKFELFVNKLYHLIRLRKINTEPKLEVFVNSFVHKYKPDFFFNDRAQYDVKIYKGSDDMTINSLTKPYLRKGFTKIDNQHFKKEFKLEQRELMQRYGGRK